MDNIEFLIPEFEYHEKSILWYVYFGIVIAILVIFAILVGNLTFIAVIALGSLFIILRNERKPQMILLAIHDDGIYLGNKLYPYSEIKNFSIFHIGEQTYFIFNPDGRFQSPSRFPVADPEKIRAKLNNLLTEVEYQESLLDAVVRLMGI